MKIKYYAKYDWEEDFKDFRICEEILSKYLKF
jgi:hypothetical protein